MQLSYNTPATAAEVEITERRSRFIAAAIPLHNEQQALKIIEQKRKQHRDSRHTVYAYALREGNIKRYSDDGEPQGSAGPPVMEVLTGAELTDCIIVVTRYFGGVLLGKGGLVRAYSQSAALAIERAGIACMQLCHELIISCDYSRYGKIEPLIIRHGGFILDCVFTDSVDLNFLVPRPRFADFEQELVDLSSGGVKPRITGWRYHDFTENK